MIHWDHGFIRSTSAIGVTSWLWLATWFLQVMPIFFFVGGFANLVAFDAYRERGKTTAAFIRSRLERLLRPSLVFLGGVDRGAGDAASRRHRRHGGSAALGGHPAVARHAPARRDDPVRAALVPGRLRRGRVHLAVDDRAAPAVRALGAGGDGRSARSSPIGIGFIGGHPIARWANVAFVLLFPHQLGHAYGDGSMLRWPRKAFWAMVVAGLAGFILLTNPPLWKLFGDVRFTWFPGIGAYPKSLLGTDVEAVSNAYPPTLCFLLGGVWSIGAVMLLRPRLIRWLQHRRPWMFTITVNGVIMTLFLWHMTAYLLAVLLLWPHGYGARDRQHHAMVARASALALLPRAHPVRPDRDLRALRTPTTQRRDQRLKRADHLERSQPSASAFTVRSDARMYTPTNGLTIVQYRPNF